MSSQQEAAAAMEQMPQVDLLLAHAPAFGIHDEPETQSHQGFEASLHDFQRCAPRYFLHGHTPPQGSWSRHHHTQSIHVYGHALLELRF